MTEETHDAADSRPARHRDVDPGLPGRRLDPADRGDVRHPELRKRGRLRHRRAARADLHRRRRARPLGKLLLLIAIGAQLFCGMSSVTANSRMIYAFSRDGALPGSRVLAPGQQADPDADQRDLAGGGWRLHARPALPVEHDRLRRGHLHRGHRPVHRLRACRPSCGCARATSFQRGPWHLGRWSGRSASSRSTWVVIITILFMLPHGQPDHLGNFNYTVVAVVVGARLRRHLVAGLGAQVVHRAARCRAPPRNWPPSSASCGRSG